MIVYFLDRYLRCVGQANSTLPKGIKLFSDKKIEEIESGTTTFECIIPYDSETRKITEKMTACGNYVMHHGERGDYFYTIIESEQDTEAKEISIYCEDAGLDLLNHIVPKFPDAEMGDDTSDTFTASIEWYINKWIATTGFTIGINEIGNTITKKLTAEESTLSERLLAIAELFDAEISYTFNIQKLTIKSKHINIYKKRGTNLKHRLYKGKHFDKILIKTSITGVATALQVVGGQTAGGGVLTLDGMTYDDGNMFIAARPDYPSTASQKVLLYSRSAKKKWGRYTYSSAGTVVQNLTGDIIKKFQYNTVDQTTLLQKAIIELQKKEEAEITYETSITNLPDGVGVGDVVYLIDTEDEIFLTARLIKLETSEIDGSITATFSDYQEVKNPS